MVKNPEGKDVLIVQAWEWAKVVGQLKVEWNQAGELVRYEGRPILITAQIPDERFALEALKVYAMPIAALQAQVVAQARVDLQGDRTVVRRRESNLSNLIADAMLWKTRTAGTVIALQNGGGGAGDHPCRAHQRGQGLRGVAFREYPGSDGSQGKRD